jgi:hypothetical protein
LLTPDLKRLLLAQKFYYLGLGDSGTKEISLHLLASESSQKLGLLNRFHPLGNDTQMQ